MSRVFPDTTSVLAILLADMAGGPDHGGTEVPENLMDVLPFQFVGRSGGADSGGTDYVLADVDTFALTRDEAWTLAEQTREFLLNPPDGYHIVGSVLLDRVTTSVGPRQAPWLNPHVVRFSATYRVEVRETF